MGLFSSIGKAIFGDPSKGIGKARDADLAFQQQGVDYMQGIDQLPIELRNDALQMLSGFYGGDPQAQQGFIDRAQSSPFYNQLIQSGQEGVLSNAGAMGLSRSGNTAQDLSLSNQNVLQNLVGQNLQGMQSFTNPNLNTGGIANIYSGMGGTAGAAGMGMVNANQASTGQGLQLLTGLLSDRKAKKNIIHIGSIGKLNLYIWDWISSKGGSIGFMSDEVRGLDPSAVTVGDDGFDRVFYDKAVIAAVG